MSVSFIHTGDLHFGRQFHFGQGSDRYGKDKRVDIWESFDKIINTAQNYNIDLLLVAGDLFDSDEIDISELKRVANWFGQLSRTRVVICPGNHDYYSDITLYGLVEWPKNVTIFKSGRLESVFFPDLNTEVYGMAWIKNVYQEMPYFALPDLNPATSNILMLHGEAYNTTSEYLPVSIGDFQEYDYIALGHIHKASYLNGKTAYCGSPEALSFGEAGEHGIIVGRIEDHNCVSEFIKTQKRAYKTFDFEITAEMSFDDIKKRILEVDDEKQRNVNYYRFRLCGFKEANLHLNWLYEELKNQFYYLEIDETALQVDLDIDFIYESNKDNIIGEFIEEIRREADQSTAEKALYYGLSAILKEKVLL